MKTYKVKASQIVYFTVLIQAENEQKANDLLAEIYPDDCYEHAEIDWQIDSVSDAAPLDIENFPMLERV